MPTDDVAAVGWKWKSKACGEGKKVCGEAVLFRIHHTFEITTISMKMCASLSILTTASSDVSNLATVCAVELKSKLTCLV